MAHILIVDDRAHILRGLVLHLKQAGHKVSTCAGGMVDAFRQIEKLHPDLVVIGYSHVDECGGLELLYVLRTTTSLAHLPIILMGNKNSWYDVESFLRSFKFQPDAYLINPCHPNECPETVNRLLSRPDKTKPSGD